MRVFITLAEWDNYYIIWGKINFNSSRRPLKGVGFVRVESSRSRLSVSDPCRATAKVGRVSVLHRFYVQQETFLSISLFCARKLYTVKIDYFVLVTTESLFTLQRLWHLLIFKIEQASEVTSDKHLPAPFKFPIWCHGVIWFRGVTITWYNVITAILC